MQWAELISFSSLELKKRGRAHTAKNLSVLGFVPLSAPHQHLLELTLWVSCLLLLEAFTVCFSRGNNSNGWKGS